MKKRIMAMLICLCMVAVLLPTTAFATGGGAIQLGAGVLEIGVNTATAQTVYYGNGEGTPYAWRVIGYNGAQIASTTGNMTLIAAGNLARSKFDSKGSIYNYASSTLKTAIDGKRKILSNFSKEEKAAVDARILQSGYYDDHNTDCVAGTAVSDALLWPLSTKEANSMDEGLRKADSWWLRSPGDRDNCAAVVYGDGTVNYYGVDVGSPYGVRPAFNLNLNSVLFTSAAEGGKAGSVGTLGEVSTTTPTEWKLTLLDGSRSAFSAATTAVNGNVLTVSYSGATVGTNEYISAIVKDNSGNIKYYGRIAQTTAAEGTAIIDLSGITMSDTDTLYVFSEQYNGDKKTDYASALKKVRLTVTDLTITGGTGYTYTGGVLTITADGDYEIGMAQGVSQTTDNIVVNYGVSANITLNGVNIDVSADNNACAFKIADNSTGDVTITLADGSDNYLKSGMRCAGLQKNGSADGIGKLTIQGGTAGTGKLTAESLKSSVLGTSVCAGIGGGFEADASQIEIKGGAVTAESGDGAGIGGGSGGSGSYITISGGNVTAVGASNGAGIGGGSSGSHITISGGNVTATSGTGAGIGGGSGSSGSHITISGGNVTAESSSGAGIGGGSGSSGSHITISGGNVTAESSSGAGIGGGWNATGSNIFISGGSVNASGKYPIGGGKGAVTPKSAEENGVDVYRATITVKRDAATAVDENTPLNSLTVSDNYAYGMTDVKTDESGKIYVYLPDGKTATKASDTSAPPNIYVGSVTSNVNGNAAGDFLLAAAPTQYTIAVSADPAAGGMVAGNGTYNDGHSLTVTATASTNYHFVKWTEGSTQVSTDANYTFAVTGNRTLVAVFEADTPPAPVGAIQLGAGGIAKNNKVYFGRKGTTVVPWIALNDSGFLLSEYAIGTSTFRDGEDWGYYNYSTVSNTEDSSILKTVMDGLYSGKELFTDLERGAIKQTTLAGNSMYDYSTPAVDAYLFPLSFSEAESIGWYNDLLKAKNIDDPEGSAGRWWLRSSEFILYDVFCVLEDGSRNSVGITFRLGVRPAFHLNLNSVLFTSAAVGGKAGSVGTLGEVSTTATTEWKLTLLDGSRSDFSAATTAVNDNVLTVSYSGAKTGSNEYISAIVKDGGGSVTHYGRIKQLDEATDASGTVNIDLSGVTMTDTDTLWVFSEQYNDDKKTDYASELKNAAPPTLYTVTLTLKKDGAAYAGQTVALQDYARTTFYPLTETTDPGVYTSNPVPVGNYTYFINNEPTGVITTVYDNVTASIDYFTVSFEADGGTPVPAAQVVLENSTADAPIANPIKGTDIFGGWYEDAAFSKPWNFDTSKVTATTTLYAKWTSSGTAPVISTQPLGASVTEGNAATFTVVATGDPAPGYQWQVSKDSGANWANVTDGTGGTSAGYTTPATSIAMSGYQYRCVVSNGISPDATSHAVTLTVSATPVATYLLTVVDGSGGGNYAEGTSVSITANAPQPGMRFSTWTILSGGGTLADPRSQSTSYAMPGNAATVAATYEAAIQISVQPTDQYVVVGQQATFAIAATGDGLTYQWYINRNDGRGWVKLDGKTGTSHTTTPVTLENDGYQYGCLITDAHGNTLRSETATLHVSEVPIPPKTGDNSQPLLWLGMCLLGGLGLLLTARKRRRA